MFDQGIVSDQAHALANTIRSMSRQQKHLWTYVPSLALDADGREEYSIYYVLCYGHGLWPLTGTTFHHSFTNAFVDCATGNIVYREGMRTFELSDADILHLIGDLSQLDATQVTNELRRQIELPRPDSVTPERWRQLDYKRDRRRSRYNLGQNKEFHRTIRETLVAASS